MLSKIKMWIGIGLTGLVAFLGIALSIVSGQRDREKAEKELAKEQRDKVIEANEADTEAREMEQKVNEAVKDIDDTNLDELRDSLRKQSKDYHGY